MGLPTGPWPSELRQVVLRGEPDATLFRIWRKENQKIWEKHLPLGQLKSRILRIVSGQKIGYINDLSYQPENVRKVVELVRDSGLLFIETGFLQQDAGHAAARYHLTARQAGELEKMAAARNVVPFHFSPYYSGREILLRDELAEYGPISPDVRPA